MNAVQIDISQLFQEEKQNILDLWKKQLFIRGKLISELIGLKRVSSLTVEILDELTAAIRSGDEIEAEPYARIRELLEEVSREMTHMNLTPSEVALFVFSLKDSIFPIFQAKLHPDQLMDAVFTTNSVIDKLGLYTFEIYLSSREELIGAQQMAFMEVSVPVVRVWEKILLIPLIGMLDSSRTQFMMETMLETLETTQSKVAILDISGIPIVDTLVAGHLVKAASAARLMGADCIITGIRSKISQTLVQLGVDLSGFVTRTTLSDGLKYALALTGQKIG